ncbi:MAG TPA: hypothetical protein VK184_16605 [Nostocaceae cyanobacterium]|nr:hypothetical protein [Nostocaceae cyanobacterium]
MEPLQKQILTLSQKLDTLYQVIEQLDLKVSQALLDCSFGKTNIRDNYLEASEVERYQLRGQISFNSELEHKDVLIDGIYPELNRQAGDRQITPEIQVQRLTAQLTAAYNRIAALEEQLLRERIS